MFVTDDVAGARDAGGRVRWGRVALFYGLAFGWVCLVAAGLFLTGYRDLADSQGLAVVTAVLAVLCMPAPLVAALVVERLDRRPVGLRSVFRGLGRAVGPLVVSVVALVAALVLGMVAASWVAGNQLDLRGAGRVLSAPEDLLANALLLVGSMDAGQVAQLAAVTPPLAGLLAVTTVAAVVAGFTVNGLFAFGEEYGWRGWLADELRPLGALRANLLTGVLWGLWHAPLILMGFTYPGYERLGPAIMVAWCVPASFLLWRAREVTGTLLAPAVLHGAINAFAGVFAIVLVDPNPLVAAPAGLIGAAVVAVVAAGYWWLTRRRAGRAA